jgi:hypothetical protein
MSVQKIVLTEAKQLLNKQIKNKLSEISIMQINTHYVKLLSK